MTAPEPARRPVAQSRGGDPVRGADAARRGATEQHPLAALHEAFGNLGVVRRLADPAVQAKLEIGAPDDDYEREADRVAASVMRRPESALSTTAGDHVQRRAEDDDRKKTTPPPQRAPGAAAKKMPPPPPPRPAAPEAKKPEPKKPAPEKHAAEPRKPTVPEAKKPQPPTGVKQVPPKKPPEPVVKERKHEEGISTKPAGRPVPSLTHGAARTIQSQRGAGRPLPASERSFFEPRFGRDLSGVRVHDDSSARSAARDIQAQAFTYGQDIYFGAGRYRPGTESGRELLAHELAHTIQQRPGARLERRVQRAQIGRAAVGVYDDTQRLLTLPSVKVPSFKKDRYGRNKYADGQANPMRRNRAYTSDSRPDQRSDWKREIATGAAETLLQQRATSEPHAPPYNAATSYKWRTPHNRIVNATVPKAARDWRLPGWNRAGRPMTFEVDHLRELQLADWPASTAAWANTKDNWALLEESANGLSGSRLRGYIAEATRTFIASTDPDALAIRQAISGIKANPRPDEVAGQAARLRSRVSVQFTHAVSEAFTPAVTPLQFWTVEEIEQAAHLRNVRIDTWHAPADAHKVEVFPLPDGGSSRLFNVGATSVAQNSRESQLLKPLRVTAANLNPGTAAAAEGTKIGTVTALRPRLGRFKASPARELDVKQLGTAARVAYVDRTQLQAMLGTLELADLSPITIEELSLGATGIQARGRVASDIEVLRRANIQLVIDGDDVSIQKEFSASELDVPEPLRIEEVTLVLFVSSERGIGATGSVLFGIERVGSGQLDARWSTTQGFGFDGRFNFDSQTFTRAELGIHYHQGRWSGEGILEIGAGKVTGVSHAHLDLGYEAGHIHGTGSADFTIPGVRHGEVHFDYDPQHGLTIGGTLILASLPGIREGTISATISERPDGSGHRLVAHGEATAAIPNFETRLVIDYDDGAFLASATVPIHAGRLSGEITLGATNRPTDENNRPIPDAPPLPDVNIFGSGTAALDFGFLHGSATVRLLANGELEVEGTLSIPHVELWHEIAPPKEPLFHPHPLEFPIFGPVVVTIGGRIDKEYGLSAGVLSGSLSAHYNPAHEDQTHLHGAIHLHATAFAGLDLVFTVGVGLDALVGSLEADIALGAEIKVEAAIDPDIQIDWTPTTGVSIDPLFEASLSPKLRFHIDAEITASLAWWSKTWTKNLAQREFGSSLALSVRLPAHYDEAHGFSVNWSQLDFRHPDIEPLETAKDFLESLV